MSNTLKRSSRKTAKSSETAWHSYEEVTRQILDHLKEYLDLDRVEGKQQVQGTVASWEIEVVARSAPDHGLLLVECRRKNRRLPKEELGGFAYRIRDTGAKGGLIVTPIGLQQGARRIAAAENIIEVHLNPEATTDEYVMDVAGKLFRGLVARDSCTMVEAAHVLKVEAEPGTSDDC